MKTEFKNKFYEGKCFFALFDSEQGRHDRMEFFPDGCEAKADFMDWVQKHRLAIEKETRRNTVVINCKII